MDYKRFEKFYATAPPEMPTRHLRGGCWLRVKSLGEEWKNKKKGLKGEIGFYSTSATATSLTFVPVAPVMMRPSTA